MHLQLQLHLLPLLLPAVSACLYPRSTTAPSWSYDGAQGPTVWHTLSSNYSLCGTGTHQSPINLHTSSPPSSSVSSLTLQYPHTGAFQLTNNGHAIEADALQNYTALFDGESYVLKNLHFHLPAEHHIDGIAYPLETHFVHSNAAGGLAVVGVVFDVEAAKSSEVVKGMPFEDVAEEGAQTGRVPVGLRAVVNHVKKSAKFSYSGSLTTPPCTEGVKWVVAKEPMPISVEDLKRLRTATGHYNSRFVQNEIGGENLLRIAAEEEA